MKKQTVQEFLDALVLTDPQKHGIVMQLRAKVKHLEPAIQERMMYGGIMLSLEEDLGGIFVYKNHVSLEFGQGYRFDDPDGILQGGGKYRRHVKIKTSQDLAFIKIDSFLNQMLSL
ncbi:DUF1801 domain-containing protein [Lutimonas halocynthiae]|uniref:DUF1801 domain-containing protein n=1 Tax=Lutimonas halocynthiae TaxID=1446477 RepID=UPI0025B3622C|nr:DUF1801 domain-containing protein [Lutimonas halocynthiae]MDN3643332.1 DUF1801 domain-containing protein [Lutimonas halocynthiae]